MNLFSYMLFVFMASEAHGQNPIFITEGEIKYERKEDLYLIERNTTDLSNEPLQMSKIRISYFELSFNSEKSMYVPNKEQNKQQEGSESANNSGMVYQNAFEKSCTIQRFVLGKPFIIDDSNRKVEWKITGERRVIAGFDCKRANAIIMDSIYAVAFYTDEIIPSFGPESFSGLPGMIMGVVLPHKHISWFATEVISKRLNQNLLFPSIIGTQITTKELRRLIISAVGTNDRLLDNFLTITLL